MNPTTDIILISIPILNLFGKLQSIQKPDKGLDINPADETSHTTQYRETFRKYVENEYCTKHRPVPVNKPETVARSNYFPLVMASGSGQSSFDGYDLSREDEEFLTLTNVAKITPRWNYHAARFLTAGRLHLNSPPEAPMNWGQRNTHLNNYHSDPMEISRMFWRPDITSWWRQRVETHRMYADLFNVVRDIFSIIPHGIGVESGFALGWDIISRRQRETTGKTVCEKVVVR